MALSDISTGTTHTPGVCNSCDEPRTKSNILFDPEHRANPSPITTVGKTPMILRAFGMPDCDRIVVQMVMGNLCDGYQEEDFKLPCCEMYTITNCNPMVVLPVSGRYQLVYEGDGLEQGLVTVTRECAETDIDYAALMLNGGSKAMSDCDSCPDTPVECPNPCNAPLLTVPLADEFGMNVCVNGCLYSIDIGRLCDFILNKVPDPTTDTFTTVNLVNPTQIVFQEPGKPPVTFNDTNTWPTLTNDVTNKTITWTPPDGGPPVVIDYCDCPTTGDPVDPCPSKVVCGYLPPKPDADVMSVTEITAPVGNAEGVYEFRHECGSVMTLRINWTDGDGTINAIGRAVEVTPSTDDAKVDYQFVVTDMSTPGCNTANWEADMKHANALVFGVIQDIEVYPWLANNVRPATGPDAYVLNPLAGSGRFTWPTLDGTGSIGKVAARWPVLRDSQTIQAGRVHWVGGQREKLEFQGSFSICEAVDVTVDGCGNIVSAATGDGTAVTDLNSVTLA